MPLSESQQAELTNLRKVYQKVAKDLFGSEGPPPGDVISTFNHITERLRTLEALEHGAQLAEKMARDRALASITEQQAAAGKALSSVHVKQLANIKNSISNGGDPIKAVQKAAKSLSEAIGAEVGKSLRS